MLRKLVLATVLVAANAFAQQNTDISGADFASGKADAQLVALGRAAAASGSRLVITAPADWHKRIAAKVKAGGAASLVLRDGFYENVLVRIDDNAVAMATAGAEAPARAEADKARVEVARARAEADKSRAEADKAKAEADKSRAEADKAKAEAEIAKAQAQQAQAHAATANAAAPAAKRAPALVALPAKAPPAAGATGVDAIRSRFEQSLLGGRKAEGTLAVGALRADDTIYVDAPVRAVVRREGLRATLYWLDGDLDLRRAELKPVADNRYQVVASVRGDTGALRAEFDQTPPLQARPPADGADVRLALERSFNDGRRIDESLPVTKLRNGDMLYAGDGAAVVVRREGNTFLRFWLDGSIDLRQSAVRADGVNTYRIVGGGLR